MTRDSASRAIIVLGIDPGTEITGYGVVRGEGAHDAVLVECGVIRTEAKDALAARLHAIHDGVTDLMTRHTPDVVCVEGVFYARNVRTTVTLGHARGVILLAAAQSGATIRELAPRAIRKAVVGSGAGTKEQVQFMLTRLLRLKSAPKPADAADGVAAALAYLVGAHTERIARAGR